MGKQDKDLLLKDLCARLPYGVKIDRVLYGAVTLTERAIESFRKGYDDILIPYLRPMSSMTEEEEEEWWEFENKNTIVESHSYSVDWLNAHHFDYRGLIEKGLALEAPEGIYK